MTVKQAEFNEKKVVIGVFISRKHAHNLLTMDPKFLSSHRYIRYIELVKANQNNGITLFFFSNKYVNFKEKCVIGIYYNPQQDIWQTGKFPLPHLLYDRGGGNGKKSTLVINKFRELGIKNINGRHYFDKWDLYDRLSKLDSLSNHLPLTVKGNKVSNVFHMLNQFGHVYVKTRRGSCGKGVIRIEKISPDRFRYYYSYGGRLFSDTFTEQELIKIICRYFGCSPFIIQKPIDLMKKKQRIIDFRSEIQKNENGQLIITGTTARIGRPFSPIASNTCSEDYYPLDRFLKDTMQLDAQKVHFLQTKINRFLLTIFKAVEQVYGSFGEMGIDFGLDTKGDLWLIECNSKSAKVALYNGFGRQKVRESFSNLLKYAVKLAEGQKENKNTKEGAPVKCLH